MASDGDGRSKLQQKVDLGRGRLSLSNAAEQDLHQAFLKECRKKCDPVIQQFVQCSQREGFFVVFKCRGEANAMNACLAPLTTNDNFVKFKAEKLKISEEVARHTKK